MASFKIDESIFDKLAEILKKHNLAEIEYKEGEMKIRMSTFSNSLPVKATSQTPEILIEPEQSKETDWINHPGAIKSPMVGTCYLAPEPGAANFIALGENVKEGQPLLIIEAMKVMNLIKAPKAGRIALIAIDNAAPVEFGQLLLVIE